MNPMFVMLGAVVAGWIVQSFMTYRQAMAFNADVTTLRRSGRVSIGLGGKRYRGGRAYVAVAVDESGIVRDALTLRGYTTLARSAPLPVLVGVRLNKLAGERELPGLSSAQRLAVRQAAELYRAGIERADRDRARAPERATEKATGQKVVSPV